MINVVVGEWWCWWWLLLLQVSAAIRPSVAEIYGPARGQAQETRAQTHARTHSLLHDASSAAAGPSPVIVSDLMTSRLSLWAALCVDTNYVGALALALALAAHTGSVLSTATNYAHGFRGWPAQRDIIGCWRAYCSTRRPSWKLEAVRGEPNIWKSHLPNDFQSHAAEFTEATQH